MTNLTVKTPMRALFLKTSTTCTRTAQSSRVGCSRRVHRIAVPDPEGGGGVEEPVSALNK